MVTISPASNCPKHGVAPQWEQVATSVSSTGSPSERVCCFVSLVALGAFGLPWQDRAHAPDTRAPSVASRAAWYGIPFVALVALVITTLAVVTPMKKKMPAPDEPGPATEAPVSRLESPGPPGLG